jgi:voltage-gated potassium channel
VEKRTAGNIGFASIAKLFGRRSELRHFSLMIILFGLLLFDPLLPSPLANSIFLVAVVVSAWLVSSDRPRSRRLLTIVSLPVIVVAAIVVFVRYNIAYLSEIPLGPLPGVLVILFLIYCGWLVLRSLLSAVEVGVNEIVGTINFYLILGFIWSYMYALLEFVQPGSFIIHPGEHSGGSRFIYFSFVTLTTLGYGDITPVKSFARMLSIIQAIIGQFYVAVVVTYLLSIYITEKLDRKRDGPGSHSSGRSD